MMAQEPMKTIMTHSSGEYEFTLKDGRWINSKVEDVFPDTPSFPKTIKGFNKAKRLILVRMYDICYDIGHEDDRLILNFQDAKEIGAKFPERILYSW